MDAAAAVGASASVQWLHHSRSPPTFHLQFDDHSVPFRMGEELLGEINAYKTTRFETQQQDDCRINPHFISHSGAFLSVYNTRNARLQFATVRHVLIDTPSTNGLFDCIRKHYVWLGLKRKSTYNEDIYIKFT